MQSRNILIVKTGHTELLTQELSGGPSLGDVYRATCLLEEYKDDFVWWITSKSALSLLPDNTEKFQKYAYDSLDIEVLKNRKYDLIINLERLPEIASLIAIVVKHQDAPIIQAPEYEHSRDKREGYQYQHYLFDMLNIPWRGQEYKTLDHYSGEHEPQFDFGFNHAVGPKWPVKAWPKNFWRQLSEICDQKKVSYSFQEGFNDLRTYFDWLYSHRVIITSDSLGLHLALGMKRHVIGLFGPTRCEDIHFYNRGEAIIASSSCPILPCYLEKCTYKEHCMETISPDLTFDVAYKWLTASTA